MKKKLSFKDWKSGTSKMSVQQLNGSVGDRTKECDEEMWFRYSVLTFFLKEYVALSKTEQGQGGNKACIMFPIHQTGPP